MSRIMTTIIIIKIIINILNKTDFDPTYIQSNSIILYGSHCVSHSSISVLTWVGGWQFIFYEWLVKKLQIVLKRRDWSFVCLLGRLLDDWFFGYIVCFFVWLLKAASIHKIHTLCTVQRLHKLTNFKTTTRQYIKTMKFKPSKHEQSVHF